MQDTEFLGQSFTYMVMTSITVLATTKVGTSHGTQLLKCFTSRNTTGLGAAGAAAAAGTGGGAGTSATGCTAFAPRRELTRTWISDAEEEEEEGGGRGPGSPRAAAIGDAAGDRSSGGCERGESKRQGR